MDYGAREPNVPHVAVVLAAGCGSRLRRTSQRPKPLTPVLGLSLAERVICTCLYDLGVRRFVVVLGHEAEAVRAHFAEIAARRGAEIDFAVAENWRLGNGASALAAKACVGHSPFLLLMCDHLFDAAMVRRLLRHAPRGSTVCLAADRNKDAVFDLDDVTRIRLAGDRIAEIGKGLASWDAADTGLFLCRPQFFAALERAVAAGRCSLSDAVRDLAEEGRAAAVDVTGATWIDVDTPEALREAERRLLDAAAGKATDGPVSRHLNRPASRLITRWLVRLPVTPTQISVASWLLSCLAAGLFAWGGYAALAAGGVIAQLASIIDGCDGEVARLKRMESAFGGWFDAVLDRYADAFLLLGLTWHVFATSGTLSSVALGFAALIGSFMNSYTADKYDGFMIRRLGRAARWRLGRDIRVLAICLGAVLDVPLLVLGAIAAVTNLEVIRRVYRIGHAPAASEAD